MISNLTTCDLCAATAPTEKALDFGFTRLVLQGEGPGKLRPLIGDGAHLDLCGECFAAFLSWAADHKVTGHKAAEPANAEAAKTEVEPVPVSAPAEAHAEPTVDAPPSEAPTPADPPTETHA